MQIGEGAKLRGHAKRMLLSVMQQYQERITSSNVALASNVAELRSVQRSHELQIDRLQREIRLQQGNVESLTAAADVS